MKRMLGSKEESMKRVFTCTGGLLLSFAFVSIAYGGAIENKTNWSAEYIRTLNRNAATDYADIAAFNPAGTVKLQDGFIINGSAQYLRKNYENIINGTSFESEEPSVVPGIFAVYNRNKWSIFGAVTVVGGGGKVDFSQGNWTTLGAQLTLGGGAAAPGPAQLEAESVLLGYTLGGAYEINDMFSVSVGIRYVDASREAKASGTMIAPGPTIIPLAIDFEEEGDGWGGIFGLNIAPNEKFNIGMRFETKTNIDLEATVNTLTSVTPAQLQQLLGIVDGQERPRDLPGLVALGVSYWINPKLRLETNYTHYLNTRADWGGDEDLVNDGYDLGIMLEYHFSDRLLASIGFLRTVLGVDADEMLPENPELDANTIGAGIAYAFNEKFHTNVSIGNTFYGPLDETESFTLQSDPPITVEYEKNVFFLALGLEYRF